MSNASTVIHKQC